MKHSLPLSIAATLALILPTASELQARQLEPSCLTVRTAPQLFEATTIGPQTLLVDDSPPYGWNPGFARLQRGTVQYVSANYILLRLVTDRCTGVSEVRFGSRLVTTANTDGYRYFDQVTNPMPGYPGRVLHSLSIHFPYGRDGAANLVRVTMTRPLRSAGMVEHSFPLVRVFRIEAKDVPAPMGFSEPEMFNTFARSLYDRFNGSANSASITANDGDVYRIYGYDPRSMFLTIDSRGVSFGFRFRIDTRCQPRAQVEGRFELSADRGGGVSIAWVVSPFVRLQYSDTCEIILGTPVLGDIVNWIFFQDAENRIAASVADSIEAAIRGSLPNLEVAAAFLAGSSTRPGEVLVNFALPVSSVLIQVPYDAFDMNRTGTAFAPDEVFSILASALSPRDYVAGVDPPTTMRWGPNGVAQAGTARFPNALSLARWEPLVWSGVPVGRMLARRTDPPGLRTYQYRPGCSIAVDSRLPVPVSIRLGVNDTATDAARIRPTPAAHGYWVRLLFGEVIQGRRCQVNSPDLVSTP